MSTITKIGIPKIDEHVLQGDVFRNMSYIYKVTEENDYVDFTEFTFPHIIVLSQACDVNAMSGLIASGGKTVKHMMSVLVAPIYDKNTIKTGNHYKDIIEKCGDLRLNLETSYSSNEFKVIEKDYHYRYHLLTLEKDNQNILQDSVIDFKQYFTLSAEALFENRKKRICTLDPIFREQVTLKFATYLSRVAIP